MLAQVGRFFFYALALLIFYNAYRQWLKPNVPVKAAAATSVIKLDESWKNPDSKVLPPLSALASTDPRERHSAGMLLSTKVVGAYRDFYGYDVGRLMTSGERASHFSDFQTRYLKEHYGDWAQEAGRMLGAVR